MNVGDMLASGTISGPERNVIFLFQNLGCMLEMTKGGKEKIQLEGGEERTFLEDGDSIVLSGFS